MVIGFVKFFLYIYQTPVFVFLLAKTVAGFSPSYQAPLMLSGASNENSLKSSEPVMSASDIKTGGAFKSRTAGPI